MTNISPKVMDPMDLKVLCLKTVIPTCSCVKEGCNKAPMCFLIFEKESMACCLEHFQVSQYHHDGYDCYVTAHNNTTQYIVYVGLKTVYIHNYSTKRIVSRYENVLRVILGSSSKRIGNTILLELEKGSYFFIADYLCSFESKDDIQAFYSVTSTRGVIQCIAVGTRYVYLFPYDEPGSHSIIKKDLYPEGIDWNEAITFQTPLTLTNSKPLQSSRILYIL